MDPHAIEATLRSRWQRFWPALTGHEDASLGERLLAAWAEPGRAYHTQEHLHECLMLFDALCAHAKEALAIEAALWFHDAIYDSRAHDNERRSADWAREALTSVGVDASTIAMIDALIMATCHAVVPGDADTALLIDIDLAILGADAARFDRYDGDVRREYAHVSAFAYRIGRRRILRQFLARPSIYSTPMLRNAREAQARTNLRRAIRRLWWRWPIHASSS